MIVADDGELIVQELQLRDDPPGPLLIRVFRDNLQDAPVGSVNHFQRLLRCKGPDGNGRIVKLKITLVCGHFPRVAAPDRQPRHVLILGQPREEAEP